MKEFIAYLVKNLVENPQSVEVRIVEGQQGIFIEIVVAHEDIARVVGRKGRTIQALRTIAMAIGARFGRRVRLELAQSRGALERSSVPGGDRDCGHKESESSSGEDVEEMAERVCQGDLDDDCQEVCQEERRKDACNTSCNTSCEDFDDDASEDLCATSSTSRHSPRHHHHHS